MAIILVGFMGAGKSTIGAELSKNLKMDLIDMDEAFEERTGISIKDYFAQYGEESFRREESKILSDYKDKNIILSTGGGIINNEENLNSLKKHTPVIYLKADYDTLYTRLLNDKDSLRPLFINNSKDQLALIFEERLGSYEQVADIIEDVSHVDVSQISENLLGKLTKLTNL